MSESSLPAWGSRWPVPALWWITSGWLCPLKVVVRWMATASSDFCLWLSRASEPLLETLPDFHSNIDILALHTDKLNELEAAAVCCHCRVEPNRVFWLSISRIALAGVCASYSCFSAPFAYYLSCAGLSSNSQVYVSIPKKFLVCAKAEKRALHVG